MQIGYPHVLQADGPTDLLFLKTLGQPPGSHVLR
jgi:hypothetical protein